MSPRSTSKLRFKPRFQTSMLLAKLAVTFVIRLVFVCLFVSFCFFGCSFIFLDASGSPRGPKQWCTSE